MRTKHIYIDPNDERVLYTVITTAEGKKIFSECELLAKGAEDDEGTTLIPPVPMATATFPDGHTEPVAPVFIPPTEPPAEDAAAAPEPAEESAGGGGSSKEAEHVRKVRPVRTQRKDVRRKETGKGR